MFNARVYVLLALIIMLSIVTGCGGSSGGSDNAATSGNSSGGGPDPAASAPTSDGTNATTGVPGAAATELTLSWDAPLDTSGQPPAGLAGFKVYFGTSPGSYTGTVDVGMATTYALGGLSPGIYYFAVTDYDATGDESEFSNEVSKTIL